MSTDNNKKKKSPIFIYYAILLIVVLVISYLLIPKLVEPKEKIISYSEFVEMIRNDEAEKGYRNSL